MGRIRCKFFPTVVVSRALAKILLGKIVRFFLQMAKIHQLVFAIVANPSGDQENKRPEGLRTHEPIYVNINAKV